MKNKIIVLTGILAILASSAAAIDINSSRALQYYGADTLDFEVETNGNADLYGNLDMNGKSVNGADDIETNDLLDDEDDTLRIQDNIQVEGKALINSESTVSSSSGSLYTGYTLDFPDDPYGGGGDTAYLTYRQDGSGEDTELRLGVTNDNQDNLALAQGGATAINVRGSQTVDIESGDLELSNNAIDNIASIDGGGDAIQVNDQLQLNANRLKTDTNGNYIEGSTASFSRLESGSGGEIDVRSSINFNSVNMKNIQFEDAGDLDASGNTNLKFTNINDAGSDVTVTSVDNVEVDEGAGFRLESPNSDTAKLTMGSHWKTIYIDGTPSPKLVPSGQEPLNLATTNELSITADSSASPQTLTFDLNAGNVLSQATDLESSGDISDDSVQDAELDLVNGLTVAGGAAGDGSQSGFEVDGQGNLYFSGSLNFPGNVNTVNAQELNGSFLPSRDAQFNIGSTSNQWKNGYFSGTVTAANFIDSGGANIQDKYVNEGGDTMSGSLNMGGEDINNATIVNTDFVQKAGGNADIEFTGSGRINLRNSNNEDIIRARNSGEIDIPRGNIDVSGGTVDARGGGDLLNDGFRLEEDGVLKSRTSDGNLYFDIESNGGTTRLRDSGNSDILRANDNGNVEVPNGGVDIGGPTDTGRPLDVGGGAKFGGDIDVNNNEIANLDLQNVNNIEMDGNIQGGGVDMSLQEVGSILGPNNADSDLNIQTQGGGSHVVSIEDGSSGNADIARFKEGSQSVEIPNGVIRTAGRGDWDMIVENANSNPHKGILIESDSDSGQPDIPLEIRGSSSGGSVSGSDTMFVVDGGRKRVGIGQFDVGSGNAPSDALEVKSGGIDVTGGSLDVSDNNIEGVNNIYGDSNNNDVVFKDRPQSDDGIYVDSGTAYFDDPIRVDKIRPRGDSTDTIVLDDNNNVNISNGDLSVNGKISEIGGKGSNEIRDDGDLVVDSDDKIEFADSGGTYMEVGASPSEGDTQIDKDGDVTTNGRLDANTEGGEISDDSGSSIDVQKDGDVVVTLG